LSSRTRSEDRHTGNWVDVPLPAGFPVVRRIDGKAQELLRKPGVYGRPRLSPDEKRLALEVTEGIAPDV
jgi:hypothetical protein